MKAFKIFVSADSGNSPRSAVHMDYNGNVTLDLRADTSWSPSSDILANSRISLNLDKIAPTGDLHKKVYVVTIEELSGPSAEEHHREYYERIIREREEQELHSAGISPGIARRLKGIS
jgi:hypothetical protein